MSIAHKSPIVRSIVFNLIREVHYEKFKASKKYSVDVSLVPKIKEEYFFKKGYIRSNLHRGEEAKKILIEKKPLFELKKESITQTKQLSAPIQKEESSLSGYRESLLNKTNTLPNNVEVIQIKKQNISPTQQKPKMQIVPINLMINPPNYGKMNAFLRDPSISMVICDGPETPLKIIRQGKEQTTNIVLAKQEIMNLFYQISAKTRIPLIEEGVYRVSWDNFIINAIVSEVVEPSFVLKRI